MNEANIRIGRTEDLLREFKTLNRKYTIKKLVKRPINDSKQQQQQHLHQTQLSVEFTKVVSKCKFVVNFQVDWNFNFSTVQYEVFVIFGQQQIESNQFQQKIAEIINTMPTQYERLSKICKEIDLL